MTLKNSTVNIPFKFAYMFKERLIFLRPCSNINVQKILRNPMVWFLVPINANFLCVNLFIQFVWLVLFKVSFNTRMNKLYNDELMIKTLSYFILLFTTIMLYIDGESYFNDSIFSNLPKDK